ncbi:hypothetical protein AYI68_g5950, partial [Smittium mucronatum]
TAILAVPKGIVVIFLAGCWKSGLYQVVSTGYIPTREPDACVLGCWSLPAVCQSEVANSAGHSTCRLLLISVAPNLLDNSLDLLKDASDVWNIRVNLITQGILSDASDVWNIRVNLMTQRIVSDASDVWNIRVTLRTQSIASDASDVWNIRVTLMTQRYMSELLYFWKIIAKILVSNVLLGLKDVWDIFSSFKTKKIVLNSPAKNCFICYDVLSIAIGSSEGGSTNPKISEELVHEPSSRVIQYRSGIEEVISNLKNLSISDQDKAKLEERWVKQPPHIFNGNWDEEVEPFMKTFNNHVESMGVKLDEMELISYFKEYLSGNALKISMPLSILYPKWNLFIPKFAERFDGKEKIEKAKLELKKLDIYSDEVLFIFANISTIFKSMRIYEEEDKVFELLKKCTAVDRNRILDKGLNSFAEIMDFFTTEEDRNRKFGKFSKEKPENRITKSYQQTSSRSGFNILINPQEDSIQNSKVTRCFKCNAPGHYARDCTIEKDPDVREVHKFNTPEDRNKNSRRIPFGSSSYGRDHKRIDYNITPTPMRQPYRNDKDVNLVDLKLQGPKRVSITAVTGSVILNGNISRFQYDSGAAINVISEELATELKLGPTYECDTRISQANGEGQSTKIIPNVRMKFGEFECRSDLHIIKTSRSKLLLLGIDFICQIGAEISMRKKEMTVEENGKLYTIPLTLETRSGMENKKVYTLSDGNKETKFEDNIDRNLEEKKKGNMIEILKEFNSSFATEHQPNKATPV